VQQRPFVLANLAMTADGKIDTVERLGARISGPADTARVDRLRAWSDAVMVGGRTLMAEDPRLTVRDAGLSEERVHEGRPAQPAKVGVVSRIDRPGAAGPSLPYPSRFLADGDTKVIVATTTQTEPAAVRWLEGHGAEVIAHETPRVDLATLVDELGARGIERLLVEGGSTLLEALLRAGLVDELQLSIAPLLFGGESAPTPVGGPGWPLADAIRLALLESDVDEDGDVVLRYRVVGGRES
jgi:2,5-diamino-6-(ribosylamino)-4(3H)-pyrimidinone 5'-phosphate reductase